LFFEISREARLVGNQGIIAHAQSVEIDMGDYQLLLKSSDEQETALTTNDEDDLVAGFVGISLRLLLNAAHEQNLNRRTQKAPPMTTKTRTTPEYALIRPILTHLRHRSEARAFWNSCQNLLRGFQKANLPRAMSIENSNNAMFGSLKIEPPETILSELMVPAKTSFELKLTAGRHLQVGLATFLGPPLLGSRYETSPIDFGFSKTPLSRHETRDVALASVRHMLLLDLVAHTETLTRAAATNAMADKSTHREWILSQPHSGEFTMYDGQESVRKIQLSVHTESISLKLGHMKKRPSSSIVVWTWTGAGCSKAEGNVTTKEQDITFDAAVKQLLAEGC
jgi:mediator of RNA polymerase II transcription subunit 17